MVEWKAAPQGPALQVWGKVSSTTPPRSNAPGCALRYHKAMPNRQLASLRDTLGGAQKLWIAWWIWGPLALITYTGLYVLEDELRTTADAGADLLSVGKLLLFCLWASSAWRCAKNVDTAVWTVAARAALLLAALCTAITL
jgi:hypothetical protein